jgi:dUTP pyrophosphatase
VLSAADRTAEAQAVDCPLVTTTCVTCTTGATETAETTQTPARPDEPDTTSVEIMVQRLDPDIPLPAYAHEGDAGADLVTTIDAILAPGERAVLPTGLAIALPQGYAAFVHPRSGLAARCGVALVNAPGTIDAGYRGEVQVILVNLDPRESVVLRRFDRIAQLVIQRVERASFRDAAVLAGSTRSAGGLGSTGGHAAGASPERT